MKRALILLALLTLDLAVGCTPASAQFWKHLFKKEEKPQKRPAPRPSAGAKPNASAKPGTPAKNTPPKKTQEPVRKLAATVKKDRYRIDVLAQLYLNDLVADGKLVYKTHLPDKVLPGLSFYQGVKLAADTLDSYGYSMDVYFHDITDPATSVDALLKGNKLDSADLIIGAVPAQQVAPLVAFAKKHTINFVSALSPAIGNAHDNFYFNLLQPTLERHCAAIRQAVARTNAANILIYRRTTVAIDEQCFKDITKDSPFAYSRVMMNTPMPAENLRNFLDSNGDNIIVMPMVDATYARQLLTQLGRSFPKFRFEVYGMPSWKGLDLMLKEGALPNVGINITAPFYFDATASAGRGFSETFNRVYGGKPGELAYRGYETLYWYAYLLNRYGTIFNDHYSDNGVAPFTRFDLRLEKDQEGVPEYYENNHVYQYRYQGGSFSVVQ